MRAQQSLSRRELHLFKASREALLPKSNWSSHGDVLTVGRLFHKRGAFASEVFDDRLCLERIGSHGGHFFFGQMLPIVRGGHVGDIFKNVAQLVDVVLVNGNHNSVLLKLLVESLLKQSAFKEMRLEVTSSEGGMFGRHELIYSDSMLVAQVYSPSNTIILLPLAARRLAPQ